MKPKTKNVGWLYKEDHNLLTRISNKTAKFEDSESGAVLARSWVTATLGQDDWTLVDMHFLGFRITIPNDGEETLNASRDNSDSQEPRIGPNDAVPVG